MGLFKTQHSELKVRGMPLFAWEKLFMFSIPAYTAFYIWIIWYNWNKSHWSVSGRIALALGIIAVSVGWRCLFEVRLKYPLRWKESMQFYRANAMRVYPNDRWMRFWLITYRVVTGA